MNKRKTHLTFKTEVLLKPMRLVCVVLALVMVLSTSSESYAGTVKKLTITFNSNDGENNVFKESKLYGVGLTLPTPKNSHETFGFVGWSTKKNATFSEYLAGDVFTENKNVTLYAVWHLIGDTSTYYQKPKRDIKMNITSVKCKKNVTLKASTVGEGKCKFTFKSSNKKILKINTSGKGKALKKGKVKVTVTSAEDGLYQKTSKTFSIIVK